MGMAFIDVYCALKELVFCSSFFTGIFDGDRAMGKHMDFVFAQLSRNSPYAKRNTLAMQLALATI